MVHKNYIKNLVLLFSLFILFNILPSVNAGQDYSSLNDSLVNYWTLDDTGSVAYDSLYIDNLTVNAGVVVNQTGVINNSYFFDGTNDVKKAISGYRNSDNVGSITAWINLSADGPVFSSTDEGVSTRYLAMFVNSGELKLSASTGAGAGRVIDTIRNDLNDSQWHHVAITSNGTKYFHYIDGNLESVNVIAGSNDGIWFDDIALKDNILIGGFRRSSGNSYATGYIDEVGVWNKTLTSDEILLLYNGSDGTPLTYENFTDQSETPTELNHTSINYRDFKIQDQVFDSDTYIPVGNFTFNLTTADALFVRSTMNVKKQTLPQSSLVTMLIQLNGNNLSEQDLRTLASTDDIGSVKILPVTAIGNIGNNTLTMYMKDSGAGSINISNVELNILTNKTSTSTSLTGGSLLTNISYSSATYINVLNHTINKTGNASTFLDITNIISATGETNTDCYWTNGINTTPTISRTLSGATSTGSSGMSYYTNWDIPTTETWQMYCRNNNGQTVTQQVGLISFQAIDNTNATIMGLQASNTSAMTLGAGTYRIAQYKNYSHVVGSGVQLEFTLSAYSTSGTQTPYTYVTMENGSSTYTSNNVFRYFSGSNSNGTIMEIHTFNMTPDTVANFTGWLVVPAGETLVVLGNSLTGADVDILDVTIGNLPPSVTIEYPVFNATVSGFDTVNFTVTDPNNDLKDCNVTLLDGGIEVLGTGVTSNYINVNWGLYNPGSYDLIVECVDLIGLVGSDNHTITIEESSGLTPEESLWLETIYNCTVSGELANGTSCASISSIGGELNMIAIILGLMIVILGSALIAWNSQGFGVKFLGYSFAIVESIFGIGLLYVNESGGSMIDLLRINFYVLAIVGFGFGMVAMFVHSIRMAMPEDDKDLKEKDKWEINKWQVK